MNAREAIVKNGFVFNKRYGQNFITDLNLLAAIVEDAGITDQDTVVEIGAGAGTLTAALAAKAKKVVAYEIDKALQPVLADTLSGIDNVIVVFRDFMKATAEEITELTGGRYKVVANLPYYITTPVIMRLAEEELSDSVTIMVQKEVAERLAAQPATKAYGAITAQLALTGVTTLTRTVSRNMFFPSPNVDSAVVRIDFDEARRAEPCLKRVSRLIKAGFSMRRKTLTNNFSAMGIPKEQTAAAVKSIGFKEDVRGECLSAEDYKKLAEIFADNGVIA